MIIADLRVTILLKDVLIFILELIWCFSCYSACICRELIFDKKGDRNLGSTDFNQITMKAFYNTIPLSICTISAYINVYTRNKQFKPHYISDTVLHLTTQSPITLLKTPHSITIL